MGKSLALEFKQVALIKLGYKASKNGQNARPAAMNQTRLSYTIKAEA